MIRFRGRPLKFKKPKELLTLFEAYLAENFRYIKNEDGTEKEINLYPISILGFCNYIGISRDSLCDYGNRKDFCHTVASIKGTIEQWVADQLLTNHRTSGVQFILKNCFKENWQDKTIVESKNTNINSTIDIKFVDDDIDEN